MPTAVVLIAVLRAGVRNLDEVRRYRPAVVALELLRHVSRGPLAVVVPILEESVHVRGVRLEHPAIICVRQRRGAKPPDRRDGVLHADAPDVDPLSWARHPRAVEPEKLFSQVKA